MHKVYTTPMSHTVPGRDMLPIFTGKTMMSVLVNAKLSWVQNCGLSHNGLQLAAAAAEAVHVWQDG